MNTSSYPALTKKTPMAAASLRSTGSAQVAFDRLSTNTFDLHTAEKGKNRKRMRPKELRMLFLKTHQSQESRRTIHIKALLTTTAKAAA